MENYDHKNSEFMFQSRQLICLLVDKLGLVNYPQNIPVMNIVKFSSVKHCPFKFHRPQLGRV